MADFLLELLSEEIPARMQEKASADLARMFEAQLAEAGLKAAGIERFVTPRRLALIVRGLPAETEAVREERRGPRADAPEQALAGFLKSTGMTRDQLEEREEAKGRFLYAVIEKPGRATAEVLAEAIPAIIRDFAWPKSMRSGYSAQRWVRPLQGIVALLDGELVEIDAGDVRSGYATQGHRFLHEGPITIGGGDDYAAKLRACHVIVDPKERQTIIRDGAARLAAEAGLKLVPDEGLVAENAGLTEWPVPLLGRFDPAFLNVPPEVITLTMRTNQKYFALTEASTGKLAPNFICVANIDAKDGGEKIVQGNQKVLAARLSDAKFFWEQDLKIPLATQAQKLDQIVFHEKLGTVADKVERVAKLARWLVEEGIVPPPVMPAKAGIHRADAAPSDAAGMDPSLRWGDEERKALADMAEQAARLCKADLVTGMVGEFPELQGVMGGYYARAEGLPDAIADAIRDHYKPVGQGDEVPSAPATVAVSLADKLDSLASFISIDEWPTGSKDPFALRRSALGIIRLILENGLRLPVGRLVEAFLIAADKRLDQERLLDFFADRLKVQQREAGVRHDLIDAVFALGGEDDLVRLLARVKALQGFIATDNGANLLAGYKRAANILRIEEKKDGRAFAATSAVAYDPLPEEAALLAVLAGAEPAAAAAVEAEDFERAMAALAALRAPIDAFFDKVTVNDADPNKRTARLGMLTRIRDAVHRVADFSRIEG